MAKKRYIQSKDKKPLDGKLEENMEKNEYLLTEEFVEFSKKISQIFEDKKIKKLELKTFYEKVQLELKALEEEAKTLELAFEEFKKSKEQVF